MNVNMENTDILYFTLGAISLMVGLIAHPYVMMMFNALKNKIKREKPQQVDTNVEYLLCKVDELEEQVNNMAKKLTNREYNRKNNIRRDVREYLEELKNGK